MTRHVRAVIALGANLGDPLATLQSAIRALQAQPTIDVTAISPVVETDPVGGPDQPVYLNAIALATTSLVPHALLAVLQGIEAAHGRERSVRWGPRTLDLDLIAIDDLLLDEPDLTIPHPRAHERGFVIVPWLTIEPDAVLPAHGAIRDLPVDTTGVRATAHRLSIQ